MSDNNIPQNIEALSMTEEAAKARYKKSRIINICIVLGIIVCVFGYFQYQKWVKISNLDYIEGNVLKIAGNTPITVSNSWTNSSFLTQLCYGSVFTTDSTVTQVKPNLAEKYEISDDGLTYVITMKDGLKWSDGVDLTVNDLKWSIETFMLVESVNSNILNAFNKIVGVDEWKAGTSDSISGLSVNGNNLTIQLTSPFSTFAITLTQFVILPEHCLKDEEAFTLLSSDFFTTPEKNVVSGMYKMSEVYDNDDLELVQNEYYTEEFSDIEKVVVYGDYQNMHIDYYSTTNITEMISYRSMPGFDEFNVDVNFYRYFVFNTKAEYYPPQIVAKVDDNGNKILDEFGNAIMIESSEPNEYPENRGINEAIQDVRVRQAIMHAIDVKTIVNEVYFGTAQINYGGVTYIAEEVYEYSPTKARKLLEEAGYDFDRTFTISYYHTDANTLAFLDRVKTYLENVGLNVAVIQTAGVVNLYDVREYDMFLKALSAFNVEDWYIEYLTTNETMSKVIVGDEFDDLMSELFSSGSDLNRYEEILHELVELEQSTLYKLPLLTLDDAVYINANRLSVPEDMVFGNTRYRTDLRLDEWYIKKS